MGTVRNKMSKHKNKWYEPYKIVTILDKSEIARRIESKTAFIASRYDGSIDDLLFYSAKKYDGGYRGYISPRKIPPSSRQQVFLPKAIIEIFTNSEGKSCVFVRLKKTIFSWVGYCVFFLTLGYFNVFIYVLFQRLAVFLLMKYWEFVRRRVGELLEKLLEAEKEINE